MALQFTSAVSAQYVDHGPDASIDNLTAHTILCWVYATEDSHQLVPRIAAKAGYLAYTNGSHVTTVNGLRWQVPRATTRGEAQSVADVLAPNVWTFIAATYDESDGPRIFTATLTSPPAEVSYDARQVGAGATNSDDTDAFRWGNRNTTPSNDDGFRGRIARGAYIARRMTLAEIERAWEDTVWGDADARLAVELGIYGTGTQPDWSGNRNNGTVTGATVANHVPLPRIAAPPFGASALAVPAAAGQTVTPNSIAASFTVAAVSLAIGAVSLTPSPVAASLSATAPTVEVGGLTVTPDPVAFQATVPAPTVAAGEVTLTPSPASAAFAPTVPTVSAQRTLTPSSASAALSATAPTLDIGGVTLTPGAVAAAMTATAPTVSTARVISPSAVVAAFSVPAPVLERGAVTLTPAAVAAALTAPAPVVEVGGVTLAPNPVGAAFSAPPPTLQLGAVVLAPDAVAALLSATTPTVVLGPLTLTPAPVAASFTVTSPAATVGPVVLIPDPVVAAFTVLAPNVVIVLPVQFLKTFEVTRLIAWVVEYTRTIRWVEEVRREIAYAEESNV